MFLFLKLPKPMPGYVPADAYTWKAGQQAVWRAGGLGGSILHDLQTWSARV